ncbi:MAG: hypothetical protein GTN80_07465 [Nitrososphaeria archaeon]|nr:hypothetical protein [Nitrososphaeria archaeon]
MRDHRMGIDFVRDQCFERISGHLPHRWSRATPLVHDGNGSPIPMIAEAGV